MDWLEEFQKKFIEDKELTNLKEEKFYGNITINFYKGKIVDVNKYQTRKPIYDRNN